MSAAARGGAVPVAVGVRGWLAVLVALLLLLAGTGTASLLVGDAHHGEAVRLEELARTGTELVLAVSEPSGAVPVAPDPGQAQRDAVEVLAARALELASTAQERRVVEREVAAARDRLAGGDPTRDGAVELGTAHRELLAEVSASSAVLHERETRLRDASLAVVGLVLAGALALTLVLAVRVRRGLVHPLAELAAVLGALTAGDHARRADAGRGPAEVRAVARWVNALADEGDRTREAGERSTALRRLASEVGRLARDPIDPRASLAEAMRVLGEGLGVDRAWVRLVDDEPSGAAVGMLQGWAREGAPPVVDEVGAVGDGLPAWLQQVWDADGHYAEGDLRALVERGGAPAATLDFIERTGATSVCLAPVGAGEVAVGALTVFSQGGPRAWAPEEVALVRSVAADLGRAIVVARLLHDSEVLVDRMRELDVRKSTFLATVSHELRTPLTSIAGYLELLREGGAGPVSGPVDRMLDVVERNAARLRVLIEDLLALSHIEDGAPRGAHGPVPMGDVVREVVAEHRVGADAAEVALGADVDLDAELLGSLRVHGDAASLRRALGGLVSNAVKFTPRGGSVVVRVRRDGDSVVVEVADTGIGIPLGEQGGLFTRFFRASNATALAVPGAGLGLTIARSLVEHHDGRLAIASAPGEGTTARVQLPAPRSG